MAKKSKTFPRLLTHVLQAVADLRDTNGSTLKQIMNRVQLAVSMSNIRPRPRNIAMQVQRAIKHGIDNGVLKQNRTKIYLTLGPQDVSAHARRKLARKPKRKTPQSDFSDPVIDHTESSASSSKLSQHFRQARRRRKGRKGGRRRKRRLGQRMPTPANIERPPAPEKPFDQRSSPKPSRSGRSSKHNALPGKTMQFYVVFATSAVVFFQLDVSYAISLTSKSVGQRQKNNHQNISTLLDNLLRGYDNSIRPDFGGPPAIIEVDIMVRSMGPISEVDMTYSMDCYFRQSWVDTRLAFPGDDRDTLALSISMLARIWKPDTYFYNGKQSYLHTITTPNKFVRLYQNGRVLYSSRLTIKAGCPMNLEDFPMDIQRCPLKFGSFGYASRDVIYRWNSARQVAIAEDMKLSQFDLIATPAANHTDTVINSDKQSGVRSITDIYITEYSMLLVSFHLQRHMGNFLIQVYGPCVLLVVLSWVSFWLNREATADRVSLGITTVLTMTFLGLEARTDLPKVPYPTALDFFVFVSFAFIFATIIQFAVVHYFTKYGSGECYFSSDLSSESSSEDEDWHEGQQDPRTNRVTSSDGINGSQQRRNSGENSKRTNCQNYNRPEEVHNNHHHLVEVIPLSMCSIPMTGGRRASQPWNSIPCMGRSSPQKDKPYTPATVTSISGQRLSIQAPKIRRRRKKKRAPRFNSVSKIDRASRVVFPLLFLTINLFYWYSYLSRTERIRQLNVT